jgi:hypothetical protein
MEGEEVGVKRVNVGWPQDVVKSDHDLLRWWLAVATANRLRKKPSSSSSTEPSCLDVVARRHRSRAP